MDRVMMDQSSVNSRRGGNSVLAGDSCANYRSFPTTMRSGDAPNSHASMSSLNHLLLDHSVGGYGTHRPPLPVYSSLPPSFSSLHAMFSPPPPQPPPPLIPHSQPVPPLLPLPTPFSRSATLPVPTSKPAGATGARTNYQRKKQKPKKKETPQPWASVVPGVHQVKDEMKKPLQKLSSSSSEEYELEGEQEMDSVYSLSPPPSSLPMPSYALMKPRGATVASCTAQAMV